MSGSAKTPKFDLKQLEETYSGWVKEAEEQKIKDVSSTRARLGASGLKEGSALWDKSLEDLESAHMKYLAELEGTETFKLIKELRKKEAFIAQNKRPDRPAGFDPLGGATVISDPKKKKKDDDYWGGGPGDAGISGMGAATGV